MLLLILLLIINMKKNMKFDKFDKRTATERLQLYEDALGACELLRRIRESQYVYLFLDQSALMKISMVTHFKRVEIEETRQLFLICEDIDTILQRIADVGDVELPLDDKTRYEKISSKEDLDKTLTELRQIDIPLLNAQIRLEQNNVFSAKVLKPVLQILSRAYANIGIDFFMSLPQGDKWEKYKITKREFFKLLYMLPRKESLAILKYIPEIDYSQLVDIYENKDADRFLAISENLKIDYVMASYNCYANFMSIFDMAKRMAGIDVFSSAGKTLMSLIMGRSNINHYSLKNVSDSDLYFMLRENRKSPSRVLVFSEICIG